MDGIIVGDSQTNVIQKAYLKRRAGRSGDVPNLAITWLGNGYRMLQPFSRLVDGRVEFTEPSYAKRFEEVTGRTYFARRGENLLYGLCMGFHTTRVWRHPSWKTCIPWRLHASFPGSRAVSDQVMRAIFEKDSEHIRALCKAMKDIEAQFFLIMAPPPQARHPAMLEKGLSPVVVRHVDELYRDYMLEFAGTLGAAVIGPPDEVYDSDGFLKRCYWNERSHDHQHANAAYGDLVLTEVLAYIDSLPAATQDSANRVRVSSA